MYTNIKNAPQSVMIASKDSVGRIGSRTAYCVGMFTLDALPGVVLCITADGDAWAVSEYRSGRKFCPIPGSSPHNLPTVKLAASRAQEVVDNHGAAKVLRVVRTTSQVNEDPQQWLL